MGTPHDAALRHRRSSIRSLIQSFEADLPIASLTAKPDIELLISFFKDAERTAELEIELNELIHGGIERLRDACIHPERFVTNAPAPPIDIHGRTPARPWRSRGEMIESKKAQLESDLSKAEARASKLKKSIEDWYLQILPKWDETTEAARARWTNRQKFAMEQYGLLKLHYEEMLGLPAPKRSEDRAGRGMVTTFQEPSNWTPLRVQQNIDPVLLNKKQLEISREMQKEAFAARRQFARNPSQWIEAELNIAEKWAKKLWNAWKEIWEIQGFRISHAFYRAFYDFEIVPLLGARKSSFLGSCQQLELVTRKPHFFSAAQQHFAREIDRLAADWNSGLEVESRKAMYATRREQAALTEPQSGSITGATDGTGGEGNELQKNLIARNPIQPEVKIPKLSNGRDEATRASLLKRIQNAPEGFDFKNKSAARALDVSVRTIQRRLRDGKLTVGAKSGTVTASSLRRALRMKRPAAPDRRTRT